MRIGGVNIRTKQAMRIASLASVLLVTGCGGETQRTQQQAEVISGLRVQKVELQNAADELEAPGSVIAISTAKVAARTMGTVLQVAAREGDTVKRGQLLAQLDERELSARRNAAKAGSQGANAAVVQATKALAAAHAQSALVQKTYDRYVYLKQRNSVSPQEFDEVSTKQEASQASLEQAKANLQQAEAGAVQAEAESRATDDVASYARIVAPFSGRLIRRSVDPGTLVSPGMELFVVEDTSRYQLEATLPAASLKTVKKDTPVRVQLDSLGEESFSGKVAEMEAGADPVSHTWNVRIDLPKDVRLRSGMFGRAFFAQGEKRTLLLPRIAMVSRGQLQGAYVVGEGNLLHWRVITLGKEIADRVEVLSGLNSGEIVVLNPGANEVDGKKVELIANTRENRP